MNIPTNIKVGAVDYQVQLDNKAEHQRSDAFGFTSHGQAIISLEPELSRDRQAETLLHELMHCAFFVCGVSEILKGKTPPTEEEIINGVSNSLFQIIRDNQLDFRK